VKGIVVDARYGLADVSTFFSAVQTPDTVQAATPPAVVDVTGVLVSPTTATIAAGESVTLVETIAPANATAKAVTWSSSDDAVATVTDAGVVAGVAAGTANVTVTTHDGSFTATCAVTVTANGG
jgi:uncharacterized protein YjdB